MADILKEYKELEGYIEEDFIIEYKGEYYTAYGKNCPHCKELGINLIEDEMEKTGSLAIRRAIGYGSNQDNSCYVPSVHNHNKLKEYDIPLPGRFVSKEQESGFLPDSDKVIIKVIKDFPTNYKQGEVPFIVFNRPQEEHICLRQVCSSCEYKTDCISEIKTVPNKMVVTNGDFRAQEPRAFTIYKSGEPKWLSVFQNDSLRGNQNLLDNITLIFQQQVKIDTNIDHRYWEFLDYYYFDSKEQLYRLNYYVEALRRGEDTKKDLDEEITDILEKWNNFKTQREIITEKKHKLELAKNKK